MTDTELLLRRLRQTPDDQTLMGALSDAFREAGEERKAEAVLEYQNWMVWADMGLKVSSNSMYGAATKNLERLRFLIGLTCINDGDLLTLDTDGRVYPNKYADRDSYLVASAVSQAWSGQRVKIQSWYPLYHPDTGAQEPEWEVETARL